MDLSPGRACLAQAEDYKIDINHWRGHEDSPMGQGKSSCVSTATNQVTLKEIADSP
jgi:hypothetical protein